MESKVVVSETLDVEASVLREIGDDAIWSLSSAKTGNGIEQLRDNNLETYWQSDGMQPHLVNIQFVVKASVSKLCLYMDYKADESYTPKKLSIRSGTCTHDLVDLLSFELTDPTGWVSIPLQHVPTANDTQPSATRNSSDESSGSALPPAPLRTFMLQIRVHSMHQNGRDTHIRLIKLFSPRQYGGKLLAGMHSTSGSSSSAGLWGESTEGASAASGASRLGGGRGLWGVLDMRSDAGSMTIR